MAESKYVAYVGTYTHETSVGIYVYDVDPDTGKMVEQSVAPINNPSDIINSKDNKYLYSIADEGVASFKILENGDLEKMNQEWVGGMRGCNLCVDSQNRYLFVAGYHDGRVTMMKLNEDGSISGIADGIFHQGIGKSVADRPLYPHCTCVELTPDERFLCAVENGLHQIKIYEVDYEMGKLHLVDIVRCAMGSAPLKMKFSPDGKYAYVITEMSNEILVYDYHIIEGHPDFENIQTVSLLVGVDEEISTGTNIKFGEDGKFVYASVDGLNAICMYERDERSGKIKYFSHSFISGDYPKSFAVLPKDKYYVSLNHDTNEIRSFTIDKKTGHSLMQNAPIKIAKPNSIVVVKIK
ncbi:MULTISPECIES: lactonase family protein [unclassified Pseudobutyrivibrio]|uniref:lactonase family protein n=1 Tax=unclassified Pseudobutyrivibrio TaxID=2638619 RepID=UPI0005D21E7B|nr:MULTISPECIES: beta-propeller fold lactonase family protein [unclassified Pseudobutyrivibrio]SES67633.1 6-phosphogluconolactonase [Pseudobutyrivibrio sp. C4]